MSIKKEKLNEWVDLYLDHVEKTGEEHHVEEEEGYKFKFVDNFQKEFNLEAPDLPAMLDRALEDTNLVIGAMYFPKKMLLQYTEYDQEKVREILGNLFDKEKDVYKRLDETHEALEDLNDRRNTELGEDANTFIGLRFLSLLLGSRYPSLHHAVKPREWKVFFKYVDSEFAIPNNTSVGEQYRIYKEYIDSLVPYIKQIPQVAELKEKLTAGLEFKDENFHWMAQDVIYVTARVLASKRAQEVVIDEKLEDISEEEDLEDTSSKISNEMEFPLEEYLENFIVKNWDNIDFGEDLELYVDEDGTVGQQYTTDIGIIDVLARDKNGDFVVIELKKGRSNFHVIGQILAYIDWVKNNIAGKSKTRGIVIVADGHGSLFAAQNAVSDLVKIKYYRVKLDLIDPKQ